MMGTQKASARRGIGTLRKRADGTIVVTVCHGHKLDGSRRRISAVAHDEAEAEAVALKLATELGMRPDLGRGLTLSRWWDAYRATKGSRLARATLERYATEMRGTWLPALGDRDVSLITHGDVQDIVLAAPTRSAGRERLKALSAVLTQAVRDGHLTKNPCRTAPFELPGDVGTEDLSGIDYDEDPFAAIEGSQDVWDARTVLRAMPLLRDVPLETCWLCMVGAGLRREEALALRWRDVRRITIGDHDVTQLAVHAANTAKDGRKKAKTERSVRIVAMAEPFGSRLWELRRDAAEPVCEVSPKNAARRWKKMWDAPPDSKHLPKGPATPVLQGRMVVDPPIPFVHLGRMRATHETLMQQAGVLDSVNAAAHGHSQRVSYSNYQRPDTTGAAARVGDLLVMEGGKTRAANA